MSSQLDRADDSVRAAWDRIRIEPEKWQCSPWGDQDGGFWVVAVMSEAVVWYNDIENGFNTSPFTTRGTIGAYRCNQTSLSELLATLPEAVAAEDFAIREAASDVPQEFAGAGRVARRQTTFWELQTEASGLVRVHFSRKQEMRFTNAEYDRAALVDEHSLLNAHRQQWASVFVTDAARCDSAFLADLASRISAVTDDWRSAEEYLALGGNNVLRAGYGLLLRAPEPIAAIAAAALETIGAVPSVVAEHARKPPRPVRALVMGKNFVIAEAVRFVRLS